MQAVARKSQETEQDSARKITLIAVIGSFCIILAFGYFWYFPFYISNTISYLSGRIGLPGIEAGSMMLASTQVFFPPESSTS